MYRSITIAEAIISASPRCISPEVDSTLTKLRPAPGFCPRKIAPDLVWLLPVRLCLPGSFLPLDVTVGINTSLFLVRCLPGSTLLLDILAVSNVAIASHTKRNSLFVRCLPYLVGNRTVRRSRRLHEFRNHLLLFVVS